MDSSRHLVPILVDAAGRSGTTALMQLLTSTDAVRCERDHPYESRYLTYLFSWSRLLCSDPAEAGKWDRGRMLPGAATEIGGLPWRQLVPDSASLADSMFLHVWEEFSKNTSATHYAEKVPRWITESVPERLPCKVIHLVRDPRDIWLSVGAFNRKRGFFAFGRKQDQEETEFLEEFLQTQSKRLAPVAASTEGNAMRILRYEDMVGDPEETAKTLGAWLDLSLDPTALKNRNADHSTSDEVALSLRRWEREMPKPIQKRFSEVLGELLERFGYPG